MPSLGKKRPKPDAPLNRHLRATIGEYDYVVRGVLKRLSPGGVRFLGGYDDAYQEGWQALLHAADYYVPTVEGFEGRRAEFATYARACVYWRLNGLLTRAGIIKHQASHFKKGKRRIAVMTGFHASTDGGDERPGYFNPIDAAADGRSLPRPPEDVDRDDWFDAVTRFIDQRGRLILAMRYGFHGHGDGMTLLEVGDTLGVSRERVRQIEAKALAKIRL